jgi:NTP pyrophosphatase (non-canonical NTP hydrolase)
VSDHMTALEAARAWLDSRELPPWYVDALASAMEAYADARVRERDDVIEYHVNEKTRAELNEAGAVERMNDAEAAAAQMRAALRPVLWSFALRMEAELRRNDHKGGWGNDAPESLLRRLRDEVRELHDAMRQGTRGNDCVAKEAADVANFAMMLADLSGRLESQTFDASAGWLSPEAAAAQADARVVEALEAACRAQCWRCRHGIPFVTAGISAHQWHDNSSHDGGSSRCAAADVRALIPRGGR